MEKRRSRLPDARQPSRILRSASTLPQSKKADGSRACLRVA